MEKRHLILPPDHLVNRHIHDNVCKYCSPHHACKILWKIFLTFLATLGLPFCFTASSGGQNTSVIVSKEKTKILTGKLCNQHAQMIDVTGIIVYHTHILCGGPVAEWLCSGLQNRVHRFNSGPGLQRIYSPSQLLMPKLFQFPACLVLSILLVQIRISLNITAIALYLVMRHG